MTCAFLEVPALRIQKGDFNPMSINKNDMALNN